jgi:hypothetical protein
MPTSWTKGELATIGREEEIEIAARRPDGSLRDPVTVWAVAQGDGAYVRSAVKGRNAAWFRGVQETHEGRISAGSVEKDVRFEDVDRGLDADVDAAYRAKYRRYAGRILNSVLTSEARATTLRIVPRD